MIRTSSGQLASRKVSGAVLGLMISALAVSSVHAIPYASLIRVSNTTPAVGMGMDIRYTLNENADGVTIDIVRVSDSVVVATKSFTSGPQVTAGTVTVNWNGDSNFDDPGGIVIPAGTETYRVRITVNDTNLATTWTQIRSARSTGGFGPATTYDYQTLLNGFSPNDVTIPTDPDNDLFGLILLNHSFATPSSSRTGFVKLRTDLQTDNLGDGFGPGGADVIMRHPGLAHTTGGNSASWKTSLDTIDSNRVWVAGQFVTDVPPNTILTASFAPAAPAFMANANTLSLYSGADFPRAFATGELTPGDRIGYCALANQLERVGVDDLTYELEGSREVLTDGTLDGSTGRNASDVYVDPDTGNVYYLSRTGGTGAGRLFRWNKAEVDNAPGGGLLDDTNAAWLVRIPASGASIMTGMAVDTTSGYPHSKNVYVTIASGADRGLYVVGKTNDGAVPPATPLVLNPLTDLIVRYSTIGAGWSPSTIYHCLGVDFVGNVYLADRSTEQVRSFAPPNTGTTNIVVTAPTSQTFQVVNQTNTVTVDATAVPNGTNLFNTVSSALLSFHTGGPNSGFAGTNTINIVDFGPYDEVIPAIGVDVVDADAFVINGALGGGAKALIRARNNSGDGLRIEGATPRTVTLNNVVLASSNVSAPTDDLVNIDSGGHTLNLNNSVVTSLGAGPFANFAALPTGLLNGTSAHDAALAQSGDDGIAIGAPGAGVASTLNVNNSVVAQQGAGAHGDGIAAAAFATVNISNGSVIASNARHGVAALGDATTTINVDGTFAVPIQVRGNGTETPGAGVADLGTATVVTVDNTLFHQNATGLLLADGGNPTALADSMFTNNTSAGLTVTADVAVTVDRVTFFANAIGLNDTPVRTAAVTVTDSVFAGAGTTGIAVNAASSNFALNTCALVGAGANALATAITNPGAVTQSGTVTADPNFVTTAYSTVRSGPIYFLSTRGVAYRNAASVNSLGNDLAGGGRWVSYLPNAAGGSTIGSGGDYETLAEACAAVNDGGPRSGGNWTFTFISDINETEDAKLGQNLNGTTLTFRPQDGLPVNISWAQPAAGPYWFAHFLIGTQQSAAPLPVVGTSGVIIDGFPSGSSPGTSLQFNGFTSGVSRVIQVIGNSDGNIIRNITVDMPSTGSPQGAVRFYSVFDGGDQHPDNNIVDNCAIQGLGGTTSATVQFSGDTGSLTSTQTGNQVTNCTLTVTSSAILSFAAHGLTITGNTINVTQTSGALSARGLMFVLMPPNNAPATNVIANNVFNIKSPSTASGIGAFAIYLEDSGTPVNPVTYRIYNNMIATQLTSSSVSAPIQYGIYSTPSNSGARVYAYNNTIRQMAALSDYPATAFGSSAIQYRGNTINGVFEARNNIIIIDEPDSVAFYRHTSGPDMVEEYNTVLLNAGQYGATGTGSHSAPTVTTYATLAAWNLATGDGANSDQIVGSVGDYFTANPGAPLYTGTFVTEDPVNYRWTGGIPGDSAQWAGSNSGLAFPIPTDIDGTARSLIAPYRGAHEGAALPISVADGDANNDGVIDVADVTAIFNFEAGISGPPAGDGDVNEDTLVDSTDANIIIQFLVNGVPIP